MQAQHHSYWQIGKIVLLASLALILVIGWGQPGRLALAQEPDTPAAASTATPAPVEPVSPIVKPVVTTEPSDLPDSTPTPPPPPDDAEVIDPPGEAELGEPITDETYVTRDDVVDEEGGVIDIFDLSFVASRFGTDDPAADINLDGTVDVLDLAVLARHYNQPEAAVEAAAIPMPPSLPVVEAGGEDFGALDLSVASEDFETEAQYYVSRRPLRIGVSLNYVRAYDYMDSASAPDLYAQVAVGGVAARTSTIYNRYEIWPYWRLGWWRYSSFPWAPWYISEANYYSLPINVEIRDNDGRTCYGYYGCRDRFEWADISWRRYQRTKTLTFYPASCTVVDENGTRTRGYWLSDNRCRVYLESWGSEWPRAYVSYYVDALWE